MNDSRANLGFFLSCEDGHSEDEMYSEVARIALDIKGERHYARDDGGSLPLLEQDKRTEANLMIFTLNMLETLYRLNSERSFDPFIVMGSSDISKEDSVSDARAGKIGVKMNFRDYQNLIYEAGRVDL